MKIKFEAKLRTAAAVAKPLVVLDANELKQVSGGGGSGPNGGWAQVPSGVTTAGGGASGPNGGWAVINGGGGVQGPNGGW